MCFSSVIDIIGVTHCCPSSYVVLYISPGLDPLTLTVYMRTPDPYTGSLRLSFGDDLLTHFPRKVREAPWQCRGGSSSLLTVARKSGLPWPFSSVNRGFHGPVHL